MADGCRVMVLAPDAADGVRLSAEEERELSEAAEEIRRGEFVTGDELLAELRSFGDS